MQIAKERRPSVGWWEAAIITDCMDALRGSENGLLELKTARIPPPGVGEIVAACLLVLTGGSKPADWPTGAILRRPTDMLHGQTAKALLRKLRQFDPRTLTPAITRQIRPVVERHSPEAIGKVSLAAKGLCLWLHAVYAYGDNHEKQLSNYAALSPRCAGTPYVQLGRYNRQHEREPTSRVYEPSGFCV